MKRYFLLVIFYPLFFIAVFIWQLNFAFAEDLPDVPKIILRNEWGADEALMNWSPEYPKDENGNLDLQVKKIILHDTASDDLREDADGTGQYKGMVQAIYRYHVFNAPFENGSNQRGFDDIGYNYLIDPSGNIYQGRIGGNGVIGAQVFGFNTGTLGISIIGTYGSKYNGHYVSHPISDNLKNSLIKFIGWLAAINGIDLNQQNQLCGKDTKESQICKTMYGLVGHRDLAATLDPGDNIYSIMPKIREEAAKLSLAYKDYVYQVIGKPEVFIIRNGAKELFSSYDDFMANNGTPKKLVNVSKSFADLFLQKISNRYPDGTLMKIKDNPAIYLIENAKKRKFTTNFEEFKKMGYDLNDVKEVLNSDLAIYDNELDIKYAQDGILAKDSDSSAIYYIENGKKRLITSAVLFNTLKFDWKKIQVKPPEILASWISGDVMRYPSGTLLKEKDNSMVYLIDGLNKKNFPSVSMFQVLGFKSKNILESDKNEIARYFDAGPVKWPDGVLIRERGDYKVYQVKNGMRYWVQSEAELKKMKKSLKDVVFVDKEEMRYYLLTSLADLNNAKVLPQKTLIKEPSKIIASVHASESKPEPQVQGKKLIEEPSIRIALASLSAGANFQIRALRPYDVYGANGLINSRGAGEISDFKIENNAYFKFSSSDKNSIFEILSYDDRPAWNRNLNDNKFKGTIEVKYSSKSQKIWVINELKLDDYLKGIAEALNQDNLNYIKALIASSRSYSLYHIENGGKYGPDEIFQLNNSSGDQLYKGYGYESRAPNIVKAVEETKGFAVIFNGKPIRGVYSSDSGGTTKSGCQAWGGEFCTDTWYQYLKGGIKDSIGTKHDSKAIQASHGVGLSSAGARRLAEIGKSWQEILKYYYNGVTIEKIY